MMVVIGSIVRIGRLEHREEPVPVQESHIRTFVRRRMPPQQVVVMRADFAGAVVVANVVIIRLRQRDVDHAQNNDPD
jgi:hypothetical protein